MKARATSLNCMFCFPNVGHVILWRTVPFRFCQILVHMYAQFMERQRSKFPRDLLRSFVITDCYKILKLLGDMPSVFFFKTKSGFVLRHRFLFVLIHRTLMW